MELRDIEMRDEAGRYESLALALQAVAQAAGGEIDYDGLCAALGVSFTAVSARHEPAPGWWMCYGRDAFVEEAAALFGLRLRDLSPSDVGAEMTDAVEFPQHFEASYEPLIRTAVANSQPVLAWQGWPGTSALFWGVVTHVGDDGLYGTTMWADGPQRLAGPALQCYVVESCTPFLPSRGTLFATALRHADAYLNRAPYAPVPASAGPPPIVTGPAAYDAWEAWLSEADFDAADAQTAWREHRQHADFIVTARQSAVAFIRAHRGVLPADQQTAVEALLHACGDEIAELEPSADESLVQPAFGTSDGREKLLGALHRAEAANRRMGMALETLVATLQE